MGRSSLIEYGIASEGSDIRAHVTIPGRQIVVFRTADMKALVEANNWPRVGASQPGVNGRTTGIGHLVPITAIEPVCIIRSAACPWHKWSHWMRMDTDEKGRVAVSIVKAAIRANKFPFWVCACGVGVDLDIRGTDIYVNTDRKIQVKHDGKAYPKELGGSGNLFIQTHECNPRRKY